MFWVRRIKICREETVQDRLDKDQEQVEVQVEEQVAEWAVELQVQVDFVYVHLVERKLLIR
jgi:hypothetical protein